MSRHKDTEWSLPDTDNTYTTAQLAVLMDLRDELKKLNRLLDCPNFRAIPHTLTGIRRKLPTITPTRKRKAK